MAQGRAEMVGGNGEKAGFTVMLVKIAAVVKRKSESDGYQTGRGWVREGKEGKGG